MGRIRTKWVKTIGKELIKKYPEKFSKDFESNKKVLKELNLITNKSMRNKIAGYIVRLLKKKKF